MRFHRPCRHSRPRGTDLTGRAGLVGSDGIANVTLPFARVSDEGNLLSGFGATGATKVRDVYRVTFDRAVNGCGITASSAARRVASVGVPWIRFRHS